MQRNASRLTGTGHSGFIASAADSFEATPLEHTDSELYGGNFSHENYPVTWTG